MSKDKTYEVKSTDDEWGECFECRASDPECAAQQWHEHDFDANDAIGCAKALPELHVRVKGSNDVYRATGDVSVNVSWDLWARVESISSEDSE